jgi:hypothetical protein
MSPEVSVEDADWDADVADTRAAMRGALDTMNKAARIIADGAKRLGDGPGNLYDVEWAEGPGAALGPHLLHQIDVATFALRAALDHGQPTGPTA